MRLAVASMSLLGGVSRAPADMDGWALAIAVGRVCGGRLHG